MPEPRRSAIRSLVRGRRPKAPRRDDDHDDGLAEPVEVGSGHRPSRIVDSAIYVDGQRVASPGSLAETFESLRQQPDGMAWIGLYRPEEHEVESLASEFQLHPLAVEDAIHAHQRPEDRALRRHPLRRAPPGPLPRRHRRGRVRRGPRLRRSPVRAHRPPQRGARVQLGPATASRASPNCCAAVPKRCSMPSSTRSSTATTRSSPASATTSTRSRPRCSAVTPRCRGASTNCHARSPTSSGPRVH